MKTELGAVTLRKVVAEGTTSWQLNKVCPYSFASSEVRNCGSWCALFELSEEDCDTSNKDGEPITRHTIRVHPCCAATLHCIEIVTDKPRKLY